MWYWPQSFWQCETRDWCNWKNYDLARQICYFDHKIPSTVRRSLNLLRPFTTLWNNVLFPLSEILTLRSKTSIQLTKFLTSSNKFVINAIFSSSTVWQNGNSPHKFFDTVIQNCRSPLKLFDTVRQNFEARHENFATSRQKFESVHIFLSKLGENCSSSHKYFDTLRENCDTRRRVFGTAIQNFGSTHKRFDTARQSCDSRHKNFSTVGQNFNPFTKRSTM